MTMSCCMCEPMEQPSPLAMTHVRWLHVSRASEHRLRRSAAWSIVSVGCEPGPTTGAHTRTAGRRERKTPTLAHVNKVTSRH